METIFCQKCGEPFYLDINKSGSFLDKEKKSINCPYCNSIQLNNSLNGRREVWKMPQQERERLKIKQEELTLRKPPLSY
jgi:DNA-directed RNA polymerase subunit RPC12/RpoP